MAQIERSVPSVFIELNENMEQTFDKSQFYLAIGKAIEAAHAVTTPDYGTFNFDTPIIKLPDGTDIEEFRTRECREMCGFTLEAYEDGFYFINGICNGAQMRRTKQAEAIAESLRSDGYTAYVYYQMD